MPLKICSEILDSRLSPMIVAEVAITIAISLCLACRLLRSRCRTPVYRRPSCQPEAQSRER